MTPSFVAASVNDTPGEKIVLYTSRDSIVWLVRGDVVYDKIGKRTGRLDNSTKAQLKKVAKRSLAVRRALDKARKRHPELERLARPVNPARASLVRGQPSASQVIGITPSFGSMLLISDTTEHPGLPPTVVPTAVPRAFLCDDEDDFDCWGWDWSGGGGDPSRCINAYIHLYEVTQVYLAAVRAYSTALDRYTAARSNFMDNCWPPPALFDSVHVQYCLRLEGDVVVAGALLGLADAAKEGMYWVCVDAAYWLGYYGC